MAGQFLKLILVFSLLGASAALASDDIPPPPDVYPTPEPTETPAPYRYQVPRDLADGWSIGDLRKEKADFEKINRMMEQIQSNHPAKMDGLLVFHRGRLLLESYFNLFTAEKPHPIFSCTKSVFSTVFGIARDQGLINVKDKLYDYYPLERSKSGWDERKAGITVGHLLSMTSGLECNDVGVGGDNCGAAMGSTTDWLGFVFALPMARAPGEAWMYNGCCLSLLSSVIAKKSGMSFPAYAKKVLLGPLGIRTDEWVTGPGGVNRVDYGMAWTPRDMAKLGRLYLDNGLWKGKRIVSGDWVKKATSLHAPLGQAFGHDYGYLWHLKTMKVRGKPVRVFFANGYRGQGIFVSPEADLVCVMTASSDDPDICRREEVLFEEGILNAFP